VIHSFRLFSLLETLKEEKDPKRRKFRGVTMLAVERQPTDDSHFVADPSRKLSEKQEGRRRCVGVSSRNTRVIRCHVPSWSQRFMLPLRPTKNKDQKTKSTDGT
jgi:hypothetical protein